MRSSRMAVVAAVALGIAGAPVARAEGSRRSRVEEGAVRGGSGVSARALGAFTRARTPRMTACYEDALRQTPSLRGALKVRFTIREDGHVDEVAVGRNEVGAEVASCVVAEIRSWRTPFRPEAPVEVELPLRFTPGE